MKPKMLFTPAGATARDFRPRLWFGLEALERRQEAGAADAPVLWALHVINGGSKLHGAVLEILPHERRGRPCWMELGDIVAGGCAFVFLGGPAATPPDTTFRLRARGRDGVEIVHAARTTGLTRPARIPAEQAGRPVLPLAPGAAWRPEEYVAEMDACSLLHAGSDGSLAAAALRRAAERFARHVRRLPSAAAAREIAWAATRAVFGAHDDDVMQPEVAQRVARLARGLRRHAQRHGEMRRPAPAVPTDLALALRRGETASLYLLNPTDLSLEVRVRVERLSWSEAPALAAPLEQVLRAVQPGSARRVALLDAADLDACLACTVELLAPEGAVLSTLRAAFPAAGGREQGAEIAVQLLDGARAEVRRLVPAPGLGQSELPVAVPTSATDAESRTPGC